jgi:uncharacterized protein YcfL
MKHLLRWGLAAVALVSLAAGTSSCRTPVTSAGETMESYPSNKVKVNGRLFGQRFTITDSAVAKGDNGLLKATVSVESLRNRDMQIEFRYRWLDGDGIEVTTGSSIWNARSVGAREKLLMTGIAPSKNVEDFILDVRFAYPSTRWR